MSQVWSASANIAAYASEAMKRPQRASRKAEIEQAAREFVERESPGLPFQAQISMATAAPSLFLLTSGKGNPQATIEEAMEAYEENEGSKE